MTEEQEYTNPYSKETVFENMDDFFNKTSITHMDGAFDFFKEFNELYRNINVGCGCNRKKRVLAARDKYRSIKDQPLDTLKDMKQHLMTYSLTFKDGSEVLVTV